MAPVAALALTSLTLGPLVGMYAQPPSSMPVAAKTETKTAARKRADKIMGEPFLMLFIEKKRVPVTIRKIRAAP